MYQQLDQGATEARLLSLAVDAEVSTARSARIAITHRSDSPNADSDDLYLIAGVDQRLSRNLLAFFEVFSRAADGTGLDETAGIGGFRFDF